MQYFAPNTWWTGFAKEFIDSHFLEYKTTIPTNTKDATYGYYLVMWLLSQGWEPIHIEYSWDDVGVYSRFGKRLET